MNTIKFDNLKNAWINGVECTTADLYKYHVLDKAWIFQSVVSVAIAVKKPEVFAKVFNNAQ